ncbi:MAG: hypothetical protein ACO3OK_09530 [Limisphaerales bacterium]
MTLSEGILVRAAALSKITDVAWQPAAAQVRRLIEATEYLGFPLSADEKKALEQAMADPDHDNGLMQLQEVLDQRCLYGVHINPEMRVKVAPGPAKAELVQRSKRRVPTGACCITRQPIKSRIVGCRSKPTMPSL